jgi:hypothetical protein
MADKIMERAKAKQAADAGAAENAEETAEDDV